MTSTEGRIDGVSIVPQCKKNRRRGGRVQTDQRNRQLKNATCTPQARDAQSLRSGFNAQQPWRHSSALRPRYAVSTVARLLILTAVLAGACNDPYSQRRIERRWAHFDQTATDIADRERDGVRRVHEADETLKKWWKRDVEDFERRAPTIGDYFW